MAASSSFFVWDDVMACVGAPSEAGTPWHVDEGPSCEKRTLVSKQNLNLEVYRWPRAPNTTRLGTVILFHGIHVNTRFDFLRLRSLDFNTSDENTEGLKYERSLIAALNQIGFDCVGADMQSHGLSESVATEYGYFERFEDLVDDAELVCRDAAKLSGNGALFFLGISFGGLVATSLACRLEDWRKNAPRPPPIACAGLVLLAPALSFEKIKDRPVNALVLPLLAALSEYYPTIPIGDRPNSPVYSQFAHAAERDCAEPSLSPHKTGCYVGNLRARVSKESLDAADRLKATLVNDRLLDDVPALTFHSKLDTMTDPESSVFLASATFAHLVYTQDVPGCDQMWHKLTQEPGADVLFQHIADWLVDVAKPTPPSDAAASRIQQDY
ncbi:hypothetical protein CTAYLR_001492 [Chrysophaeum taylorii]|uniref:Serine aminopeptidase S33 domain-containing protein n=1 Tax=Chrysophaeum taylorii TaxID=2483200 RepID=A0AAD7UER3_9STRA|nr:hypothetical protein CTAYLR_001492 [Chrysophaeum taylorii]